MARKIDFIGLFHATAVLIVAGFVGGCSSFNHDWEAALQKPVPRSELQGPWQGMSHSDANGHKGKLRCIITKKENGAYRARFHARYGKVLGFSYAVILRAQPVTDGFIFNGQANLGFLAGGVYYYDGHADETNLFSNYSCKYDHGTFEMKRP